jgi:Tol biopolymer transport system component
MASHSRVALVLFALTVLSCQRDTLPSGPSFAKPGPPPPPPNPAIAFVEATDLKVMNADGSNQTLVLAAGESSYGPGWSPDGTQLVFGSSIQGPGVYVIDVNGTNLRKVVATITGGGATQPVWSPVPAPDGRFKIAYLDQAGPDDGTIEGDNHEVFLVNLDGTGRLNLTNTRELDERSPTWAPSAARLAAAPDKYTSQEPGVEGGIVVYDLGVGAGGTVTIVGQTNVTAVGPLSSAYSVFRPAWAKTHDKIAVVLFQTGSSLRDIWVIDLATPASPTNITQTASVSENSPSWSPDDSRIAYQRKNSKNRLSIFVMNADGSGPTEIGNPGAARAQSSPDWRRNP